MKWKFSGELIRVSIIITNMKGPCTGPERTVRGLDKNPEFARHSREKKDKNWEFTVKCALIIKDLMNGNPTFSDEHREETLGHNALAAGFQGQRQWTDTIPTRIFLRRF